MVALVAGLSDGACSSRLPRVEAELPGGGDLNDFIFPAPGGEATTIAGSPDQAANSAAARSGSAWCAAGTAGGGGGGVGVGAPAGNVLMGRTLSAGTDNNGPRRAGGPGVLFVGGGEDDVEGDAAAAGYGRGSAGQPVPGGAVAGAEVAAGVLLAVAVRGAGAQRDRLAGSGQRPDQPQPGYDGGEQGCDDHTQQRRARPDARVEKPGGPHTHQEPGRGGKTTVPAPAPPTAPS